MAEAKAQLKHKHKRGTMEIRRLSLKVSGDEKTPLVKVETAARFRSSKFQSSLLPCS